MFASFHSKGTTTTFTDKLNTLASGILICSSVSISSFGGIPSTPGDLLSLVAFIFLAVNVSLVWEVIDENVIVGYMQMLKNLLKMSITYVKLH